MGCFALGATLAAVALTACAPEPLAAQTVIPSSPGVVTPPATLSPLPTDAVEPDPQPTAHAGQATVTIVSSGADGQSVFASGLATGETGREGVCTLTATSGTGEILTAQLDAQSTPAAMNCGLIEVPATAGDWTLVLSYRSETTSASSAPTNVQQR